MHVPMPHTKRDPGPEAVLLHSVEGFNAAGGRRGPGL